MPILRNEEIAIRIKLLQNVYLLFLCIGLFALIYALVNPPAKIPSKDSPAAILALYVLFFAYYGLKKKREWAIPLLLFISAIMLFKGLMSVLESGQGLASLFWKLLEVGSVFFSAYQIGFFQKQEVKDYLGNEGKIII
jgi:hypothetical protein